MSERSSPIMGPAQAVRAFLGGIAVAGCVFFSLHCMDLFLGQMPVAGLSLALVLCGWGFGTLLLARWPPRRTGQVVLAALAAGWWALWWQAPEAYRLVFAPVGAVVGLSLLGWLFGNPPGAALRGSVFAVGMTAGFAAFAAGLPAAMGNGAAMMAFVIPALVASLAVPGAAAPARREDQPRASRALTFSRVCLAVALGVTGTVLVRAYSFSTGWSAYAVADLGIAFCAGGVLRGVLLRGTGTRPVLSQFARTLLLLATVVVVQSSFLLHPDLILSEAAVLQTPRSLLVPERMFPLWFLAGGLAFLVPSGCIVRVRRRGGPYCYVALLATGGCLAESLQIAGASQLWEYVAAASLCALALVALCVFRESRRELGGVALPAVGSALALVGLTWAVMGDHSLNWRPIKATLASYLEDMPNRFNYVPSARADAPAGLGDISALGSGYSLRGADRQLTPYLSLQGSGPSPSGPEALAMTPEGEGAQFVRGDLVGSTRDQDSCSVRLALSLALASCRQPHVIDAVEPTSAGVQRGLRCLARHPRLVEAAAGGGGADCTGRDVLLCGPQALTAPRCPLVTLSVEGLARAKAGLSEGGVFALWLPTRTLEPEELRRVLATVLAVFQRIQVFACRDELVLICGGSGKLDYTRLRAFFREPSTAAYMNAAGFLDPRQVLVCYVANQHDLKELTRDAQPYSIHYPCRPPVLARNLAAPSRADTLALVLQYRLRAQDRLLDLLAFSSENERKLALSGLHELYAAETQRLLLTIGNIARAGPQRGAPLLRALYDDVNLDLFAPEAASRALKLAVTMHRLGLYTESLQVLERALPRQADRFMVHYWRGRCLQRLRRVLDAGQTYEAALAMGTPESEPLYVDTLVRLGSIRAAQRQVAKAQECLERALELDEENVEALVFLSFLYGGMNRFPEAAALARRALRVDPDNRAAREQLYLYAGRGDTEPEGE